MMKFPIGLNRAIYLIEPANITKLKKGEMLILASGDLVGFTPDIKAFADKLGVPDPTKVERGQRVEVDINELTVDRLLTVLQDCKDLPEVER